MRAIGLLSFWKLKNSLRTLFTDPRKLIPLILVLLCVGLAIASASLSSTQPPPARERVIDPALAEAIVFFIMVLQAFMVLDAGLQDGLLAFAMPDVDYLFPSPISRRAVIAYRLPALTFSTVFLGFLALFFIRFLGIFTPVTTVTGPPPPVWLSPLAVLLCVGSYMNLVTYVSMRFAERSRHRKWVLLGVVALCAWVGFAWWKGAGPAVADVAHKTWLRILFYPSTLASDILNAANAHLPTGNALTCLFVVYLVSLIPMFATNANWYEQSIVSSERISKLRQAAKGGYASMMAARAETYKHKSAKTYTVKPFGDGAVALFWAHLSAAAKRPWANLISPGITGVITGAIGVALNIANPEGLGFGLLAFLLLYSGFLFMGSAKTASESAVRRKEILAPLPISGWQSVAANLGVPFLAVALFAVGVTLGYVVPLGKEWPLVAVATLFVFPLRIATRMVLQYVLVLGYPDVSDKVQQFLSQGVYYLLALPPLVGEVVVCLPGIFLKSPWAILLALVVFEAGLLVLLLWLGGIVSDRAVATGEPVSLWRTIRRK